MSTHPNDVVVLVEQAAKGIPTDYLRVLLVSMAGAKDYAEYKDAAAVKAAFGETSEVGKMAAALFGQSPTLPSVAAVGIAEPSNAQGMTAALDTIRAANDDWYLLMTDQTDENMIEAIAAWADATEPTEAQQLAGTQDARKLYVAQTSNKSATVSSKRSILLYAESGQYTAAAWVGLAGSYYPQGITWKFKQPADCAAPMLTKTELDALMTNNVNVLTTEGKQTYIKHGVMADGEWIDAVLAADYIAMRMKDELHKVLVGSPRIEYSDAGITQIAGAVLTALDAATSLGLIAKDPDTGKGKYSVVIPRRSEATQEQIESRRIPDIRWEAERMAAIHGVTVRGVLKASL